MQHRRFTPGDTAIPSSFLNDMVSLLGRQERSGQVPPSPPPFGIVKVKNTSGADVPANAVLGVDDFLFPPDAAEGPFRRGMPAIVGIAPTVADHTGRFIITRQAIAQDAAGEAWASGVCVVKIDVADESHTHADVKEGDSTQLASGVSGVATILAREAGLGSKWALIRIGGGGGGGGATGTYSEPLDFTFETTHPDLAHAPTYTDQDDETVLFSLKPLPEENDSARITLKTGDDFHVDFWINSIGQIEKISQERPAGVCPENPIFNFAMVEFEADTLIYCDSVSASAGPQFSTRRVDELFSTLFTPVSSPDLSTVTIVNVDDEIGTHELNIPVETPLCSDGKFASLAVSDPPMVSEVADLRDACEELSDDMRAVNANSASKTDLEALRDKVEVLADDTRNLAALGNALLDAMVTHGLVQL